MRPNLSLTRDFGARDDDPGDTMPDDGEIPDTERDVTGQSQASPAHGSRSYIALRQPANEASGFAPARPAEGFSPARAAEANRPGHSLVDLDGFLAARVLRLEVTAGDAGDGPALPLLTFVRSLRESLAGAGAYADARGSESPRFEARLGETLRGVYAWAYGVLDAVFLGDQVGPLPRRLWGELANHAEEAVKLSRFEASLADLARLLRGVRRASEGMALEMRVQ